MEDNDLNQLNELGNLLRFMDEDHEMSQAVAFIVCETGKAITDLVERLRTKNLIRLAIRAEYV